MTHNKRRLVAAGSIAACAVVIGGSSGATASKPRPDVVPTATCVESGPLDDVLLWQKVTLPPGTGVRLGIDTIYYDELRDKKTGAVVGHERGRTTLVSTRPSDGHILAWTEQTTTLTDGVVKSSGFIDATDFILNHKPSQLYTVGVSGRYKGWVGEWHLTLEVPTLPPKLWQASDSYDLCKIHDGGKGH
jgi:hypothetical protein